MQPDIEADPCDYYIDLDFLFEPEILFDYSDPAAQVSDTEIERSFQLEILLVGKFWQIWVWFDISKKIVMNSLK